MDECYTAASNSTSISSVIDLNFVSDECIADSVNMVDMFPQLWAESLLYEGTKGLEDKSDKFHSIIT